MPKTDPGDVATINIKIAGLGGQGVVKASDILAQAAFCSGMDVKKSELHGMSQRGGSVSSDVRFGQLIWSPIIPAGEVDYLVIMDPTQVENNLFALRPAGLLIQPGSLDDTSARALPNKKALNTALLGVLSAFLPITEEAWLAALHAGFAERYYADNAAAFHIGRHVGRQTNQPFPKEGV